MFRKFRTTICRTEYVLLRVLFLWFIGAYVYKFYIGGLPIVLGDPLRFFFGAVESLRLWFSGSFWLWASLFMANREVQKQRAEMALIITAITSAVLLVQGMFFPLDALITAPQNIDNGEVSSNILLQIYSSKNLIGQLLKELVVEMNLGLSLIFYSGLRSKFGSKW